MNKSVVILQFSSRVGGNCAKISEYLQEYYNQTNVCSFTIGGTDFVPCRKCDYECLKPEKTCPQLSEQETMILDTVCQSNLVYFIVPNYCGYPCANYFAFNERTVGYFNGDREKMNHFMSVPKRFIIVSNTEGFESAMQQQTNEKPDILYLKSGKYKKRSIAGDLLDSEEARTDLDAFLAKEITSNN